MGEAIRSLPPEEVQAVAQSISTNPGRFSIQTPQRPSTPITREAEAPVKSNQTAPQRSARVKRGEILMDAARHFSQLSRPTPSDLEQFKALFYQFIESLSVDQKRLASAMLARSPFTPRQIAFYLALEEPQVAAPFLLFSPVLGDLDLKAVAERRGASHSAIIRKRMIPVSEQKAPPPAIEARDEGKHASAPAGPPAGDGERQFNRSKDDRERHKTDPVSSSRTEPVSQARHLSGDEIVSLAASGGKLGREPASKVRQEAGARQEAGRFNFSETPRKTSGSASRSTATEPPSPQSQPRGGETTITELDKKNVRALLLLARHRNLIGIARHVETLCGLSFNATLKLLAADKGDEMLYLIRAIGIPRPHDLQFALMATPRIGRSHEAYRHAKSTLGELDQGICQMIFNEIGASFKIQSRSKGGDFSRAPLQDQGEKAVDTSSAFKDAVSDRRRMLSSERTPPPGYRNVGAENQPGSRNASVFSEPPHRLKA